MYRYWKITLFPMALLVLIIFGSKNMFWALGLIVAFFPILQLFKKSLINIAESQQGYVLANDLKGENCRNELVSIVIPCFNSGSTLGRTIKSTLAQTHKNLEVIVVDDASSDDSSAVADNFRMKDSRIKLLTLHKNVGLPEARNIGLKEAQGDYIIFLDSDDALTDLAVALRLHWLKLNGSVSAVACRAKRLNSKTNYKSWRTEPGSGKSSVLTYEKNKSNNPFAIHEVLLATEDVRRVGAFDSKMIHGGEDTDFWLRYLSAGNSVLKLPIFDSIYFQSSTSMLATSLVEHGIRMVGQISKDSERISGKDLGSSVNPDKILDFGNEVIAQRRIFEYLGGVSVRNDRDGLMQLQMELDNRDFHKVIDPEEALSLMVTGSLRECQRLERKLGKNEFDQIYNMHTRLRNYMAGSLE
jgi:glycosyltransferase involved in cell wall biosynthesis